MRNLLLRLLNKGLSKSTVNLVRHTISGPMAYAVDEELIPSNITAGITQRLGLERDKKIHVEPLNPEETCLFLDTCEQFFPEYYPFFLCALRTGMRLGELLGLRWGDVDWNGKFIEVRRSHRRGKTGSTKTGKRRRVDMSDQLLATLKRLYTTRKVEALKDGRGGVVEKIFHRDGKPMEQNFNRRVFKRVLRKAGLREMRFHDLRHTLASQLLSNGESPVYVKEQLGHSSIQMTVDIYGHLIPSSNRGAVNRLDSQQSATYPQPVKINEA